MAENRKLTPQLLAQIVLAVVVVTVSLSLAFTTDMHFLVRALVAIGIAGVAAGLAYVLFDKHLKKRSRQ